MMDTIAIRRLAGPPTAAGVWPAPPQSLDAMAPADERALAEQFVAGQTSAVQQVVDRYQAELARLVQRMLGWADHATADDLVQEVFVRAIESRHRFQQHASLKTWLTRIAINECRAHQRKQNRRRLLLRLWHRDQPTNDCPPPDDQQELAEEVRRAVAALPNTHREVIVLYYLEQQTVDEVAALLDVKPGTVHTRLSRAREQLRGLLDITLLEA